MGGAPLVSKKNICLNHILDNLPRQLISLKEYLYGNFMCCKAELIHYAVHKFQYIVLEGDFPD